MLKHINIMQIPVDVFKPKNVSSCEIWTYSPPLMTCAGFPNHFSAQSKLAFLLIHLFKEHWQSGVALNSSGRLAARPLVDSFKMIQWWFWCLSMEEHIFFIYIYIYKIYIWAQTWSRALLRPHLIHMRPWRNVKKRIRPGWRREHRKGSHQNASNRETTCKISL